MEHNFGWIFIFPTWDINELALWTSRNFPKTTPPAVHDFPTEFRECPTDKAPAIGWRVINLAATFRSVTYETFIYSFIFIFLSDFFGYSHAITNIGRLERT